ncbi:MAG: Fic family protein [Bdellovibrionales bacterium]|nr:Fic family protein [Bdellovibrionales bacterium]
MKSLEEAYLRNIAVPLGTSWLLAQCAEAKGRQAVWQQQRPELLESLRELAMVQSAESSNRIEGVEVEKARLRPLVLGRAVPMDRPEEEVVGYRRALSFVHKAKLEITPEVILKIHALCQAGAGDAGRWKARDNEIVEFDHSGGKTIRFKALSARETPEAMKLLCDGFCRSVEAGQAPPLVLIAAFILDFLCIHPFRDGNGRVSRLITHLLLAQAGYTVGRWISLERLVEESKETYYEALKKSSCAWHEERHDLLPWVNYFLHVLRLAYKEFSDRFEGAARKIGKGALVEDVVMSQWGEFTLGDIRSRLPTVSEQMVRKVLSRMRAAGAIQLSGRGRGARWTLAKSRR